MKRKVLCITLALLMCMMVTMPTFADGSENAIPVRAGIGVSFGLKHISGSNYKMWARINNPEEVSVFARLTLYDASYNSIASIYTISSSSTISLNKNVSLSAGTYHLRLTYTADGATFTYEKTYNI